MTITDGFFPEGEGEGKVPPYLKGVDFDGEGQNLEVVGMEVVTPKDEAYGVKNTYGAGGVMTKENYLVKAGVLKEGQSLKYNFKQDDIERYFENNSVTFFFAVKGANLEAGDKVKIIRNKKSNTEIKWTITKI
jgi:hypothetical protein